MIALLGLLVLHVAGAALRHGLTRCGWAQALRSPASAWLAVAVLYAASLGWWGLGIAGVLAVAVWLSPGLSEPVEDGPTVTPVRPLSPALSPLRRERVFMVIALVVLARPWVPTQWDEFVWLGKARLGALGFDAGVAAALDPAQHLIPAGYPPLWPSLVGWLTLGHDALSAHTLAASLLVLLCALTALEALTLEAPRPLALAVLLASPLVWVHLRSTYVDLPVGLLGLAVFAQLMTGRASLVTAALAVTLAGFKDEGLAQVLAATLAALALHGPRRWRLMVPAVAALSCVATWRWLVHLRGVRLFDHALGAPQLDWVPTLVQLFTLHATDVFSWGVFWAVVLALLVTPADRSVRSVKVMLVLLFAFSSAALLLGPERVRVFAENGTLLNRLLLQLWPAAAYLVLQSLPRPASLTGRGA